MRLYSFEIDTQADAGRRRARHRALLRARERRRFMTCSLLFSGAMRRLLVIALLLFTTAASANPPLHTYKLELVARPPFRFLSRFGAMNVVIYPGGVRASNFFVNAFSKQGERFVTVMSPLTRLYSEIGLDRIGTAILRLNTSNEKMPASGVYPIDPSRQQAVIRGIPATRYRILLGPGSWMDVWSTDAVATNAQYRRLLDALVGQLGRDFTTTLHQIPGTPIKVVLKSRRYDNAVLLEPSRLSPSNAGESEALRLGRFYIRAPFTRVFN